MSEDDVRDRSCELIASSDLIRMGQIGLEVLTDFFERCPQWQPYSNRLLAIALCEGGALHYVNGTNGLKDIDLWAFFAETPGLAFPWRVGWRRDFGRSKFGRHPRQLALEGRPVDIFARSIRCDQTMDTLGAIRTWLRRPSGSPAFLS